MTPPLAACGSPTLTTLTILWPWNELNPRKETSMSIIVLAIIVLILVALLIWGVDQVPQLAPTAGLIKLLIIVLAVLFIASKAGLL